MNHISIIKSLEDLESLEMIGGGIVPYCVKKNRIYLLLGRESEDIDWKESGMWSDFGGTREKNEKNIICILREFQEETNGFFGNINKIKKKIIKKIKQNNIIYNKNLKSVLIFYKIAYNNNLIKYYNESYEFLKKKLDNLSTKYLIEFNKNGLFEKDKIAFFELNNDILNIKLRKCIKQAILYLLEKKFKYN